MRPVFRFAPSPTGYLHLGHALSAAAVWAAAAEAGGTVLLRIEDIDPIRAKPEYAAAIEEDLAWLGFEWSGEIRRQSEHFGDYRAALARLEARGLLYPSCLSRADIIAAVTRAEANGESWPRDPDGAPHIPIPDARETDMVNPPALRLRMEKALDQASAPLSWTELGEGAPREIAARPADWGDVVVARKDTPTSYHLAVTVDDALQGVTHVVRGQDLYHATSIHRLLQELLGLPAPVYRHHPLLTDVEGRKLAKTRGSTSLRSLRAEGWTSNDVFQAIAPSLRHETVR